MRGHTVFTRDGGDAGASKTKAHIISGNRSYIYRRSRGRYRYAKGRGRQLGNDVVSIKRGEWIKQPVKTHALAGGESMRLASGHDGRCARRGAADAWASVEFIERTFIDKEAADGGEVALARIENEAEGYPVIESDWFGHIFIWSVVRK